MKKLLILFPLIFILYACPYESSVALEPRPVERIDSSLLGYWYGIIKDGSDFFGIEALEIQPASDSMYRITRYGKIMKGDMIVHDTAVFTGYTSFAGPVRYMNVQGSKLVKNKKKGKITEQLTPLFYLGAISTQHDTITVRMLTDNFSPSALKGFRVSQQLKSEVQTLTAQGGNIFDDIFTLSFRRIEKPIPLKKD